MNKLSQILEHNKMFVETQEYKKIVTDKYPDKKILVLGCMDTRLIELLPQAMNINNGDAKIIKNAGAIISEPFGQEMRSIAISVYEFETDEIYIVGHHECGVRGLESDYIINKALSSGIDNETIQMLKSSGIDLDKWLNGFDTVEESIKNSVKIVKEHPIMPKELVVHGLVMCPETGKLDVIVNGYNK